MIKVSQVQINHVPKADSTALNWEDAISEAESQIAQAEARIAQLRLAIGGFIDMRDHGEPFPTFESEAGDMGQKGDLGQSPAISDQALHKKSAKPNKSEPEAVATGSPLIYGGHG